MFYGNYATQIDFEIECWIDTSVSVLLKHISGAFICKHVCMFETHKILCSIVCFSYICFFPIFVVDAVAIEKKEQSEFQLPKKSVNQYVIFRIVCPLAKLNRKRKLWRGNGAKKRRGLCRRCKGDSCMLHDDGQPNPTATKPKRKSKAQTPIATNFCFMAPRIDTPTHTHMHTCVLSQTLSNTHTFIKRKLLFAALAAMAAWLDFDTLSISLRAQITAAKTKMLNESEQANKKEPITYSMSGFVCQRMKFGIFGSPLKEIQSQNRSKRS